jgi:iron complex outermembrane receptor protein
MPDRPATPRASMTPTRRLLVAALIAAWTAVAFAAQERRILDLTLDELMQVDVTTVSGIEQDRFTSPAAVHVITAEDLRRSGHRSLVEALRLVPEMFVGRTGSSSWVAGARGLTGNSLTTTRTLVLIDGRVAFDPLFNGVPFDVLDIALDDVDRIEVVRGPGATLWGVNAVNGVINVITKSARETLGTRVRVAAGDSAVLDTTAMYGGELGGGAFRVWGRYADTGRLDLLTGGSANDQWTRARAGFRLDLGGGQGPHWMIQGGAYRHPTQRTRVRQPVPGAHLQFEQLITDDDLDGGHLLLRAQRGVGEERGWSAHLYYDQANRDTSRIGIRRDTADLDFRSWLRWGEPRQQLVWGVEVFATEDEIENGPTFLFDPTSQSWTSINGFVQNITTLVPGRFHLMAGTKLTQHDFVGFEVQPSVRAWWTPSERQTLWAGVSRPVRVPSRLEEEGLIVVAYADPGILAGGPPTGAVPFGVGPDPELESEEMVAYELGHRIRPGRGWEIDTALYWNDTSRLIAVASPIMPWSDEGAAETLGGSVTTSWRPSSRWLLDASYSWLDLEVEGPISQAEEGSSPEQLAQLRSSFTAGRGVEVHGAVYYVDRLPQQNIDAYERLDLGVTWRPRSALEVAVWGQNLLEAEHAEASAVAIPRSVYGMISLDL